MKTCSNHFCNKEFVPKDYRQKYCSRSCAATVNNPKRASIRFCFCGVRLTSNQKVYCSNYCNGIGERKKRIDSWLSGEWNGSESNGQLSRAVRNYLIDQAHNKCTKCGWGEPNPVTGRVILAVDHIDGNWKNNSIDNLQVLCYNCHTLTSTFNGLNIGSGNGSGSRAYL